MEQVFFFSPDNASWFQVILLSSIGVILGGMVAYKGWDSGRRVHADLGTLPLWLGVVGGLIVFGVMAGIGWSLGTGRFRELRVANDGTVMISYSVLGEYRLTPGTISELKPYIGDKHGLALVLIDNRGRKFTSRAFRSTFYHEERDRLVTACRETGALP